MNATPSAANVERAQRAFRDGSALRVVGRARLKVDHADQAWPARQALEDGLNTADFADCGRLIVVRRLQLRGLEAGARGPAMARAIEAAWRALAPSALAFDAPGAVSAPAVYFHSATAARLAWLQRAAESRPVDAWFWRSALPELASAPSPAAAVAAVFARVRSDEPQALATALTHWPAASVRSLFACQPALPARAGGHGSIGALKSALADARRALPPDATAPAKGATPPEATAPTESATPPEATTGESAELVAWLASLGLPDDTALAALAALRLAPADPPSAPLARVPAVVAAAQRVRGTFDAASDGPTGTPSRRPGTAVAASDARPSDRGSGRPAAEHGAGAQARTTVPLPITALPAALPAATRVQPRDRARHTRWPWLAANEPTAHGGLLLLLNVLRPMQFDAWLEQQAPADRRPLVALLFETLADRLGVPADDPQRTLFSAAAPWRHDAAARESIDRWLRRLRRVLRLQARIGLASLARRDAGIAITATHVDVVMPLHAIDLRLRRTGLDSDPGWLPWFGWIVKLHYVASAD